MKYLGDYKEDAQYLDFTFSTTTLAGVPITLAGTPSLVVYKGNGTTESTAGITLTVDFDSVTGLHHVRIDLSADAFYAVASDYSVVIAAGTVDGVSVVGRTLATFSIENRFDEVDVAKWLGTVAATPDTAGHPKVTIKDGTGTGEIALTAGKVDGVATVDTTTTNTDMRGTDGANTSTPPTVEQIDTKLTTEHGADSWQTASTVPGVGPVTVNIVDQFAAPVVSADVVITDTVGGGNYFGGDTTDASGDAVIDALATGPYTIVASLIGYEIPDTAVTVTSAAQEVNIVATKSTANAPVDPSLGLLFGDTVKITGTAAVGVEVIAEKTSDEVVFVDSIAVTKYKRTTITDSNGRFEFELLLDVELTIKIDQLDYEEDITLTAATTNLEDAT